MNVLWNKKSKIITITKKKVPNKKKFIVFQIKEEFNIILLETEVKNKITKRFCLGHKIV